MPASQHTVATERQRRQQEEQTLPQITVIEDPCEQAQLLSELEHAKAIAQQY
jgi:hypothetical protein